MTIVIFPGARVSERNNTLVKTKFKKKKRTNGVSLTADF